MQKLIKKVIVNPFFQGGLFLIASNFIISFFNYLFSIISGRLLGPKGYGEIITFFSYLTVFSVPLGIASTIIIQKISSQDTKRLAYTFSLDTWIKLKIKRWWFVAFFLVLFIPFMPRITNLTPIVAYAIIPITLLTFVSSYYLSILQGVHLFFYFSLITILLTLIKLAGALAVSFKIDGISTIVFFLFLSPLIGILTGRFVVNNERSKFITQPVKEINKRIRDILLSKQLILTAVSILSITLLNNLDIIIVKKYFSANEAGYYSAWSLFAKIIYYFTGPIITISFVFFSGRSHTHRQKYVLKLLVLFLGIFGIVSYFIYSYFSHFVINFILGNKFTAISTYLGFAAFFGTFYTIVSLINTYFIAKKSFGSYLLVGLIPFYFAGLLFFGRNIQNIVIVNSVFSFLAAVVYFIAFLILKDNAVKTPQHP